MILQTLEESSVMKDNYNSNSASKEKKSVVKVIRIVINPKNTVRVIQCLSRLCGYHTLEEEALE